MPSDEAPYMQHIKLPQHQTPRKQGARGQEKKVDQNMSTRKDDEYFFKIK